MMQMNGKNWAPQKAQVTVLIIQVNKVWSH